jgi:hypothetical protein
MRPSLDVRRHHDGTIDFDFYRRRAVRRRRLARRLMLRHYGAAARKILRASIAAVARATAVFSPGRRELRLLTQPSAVGAVLIGRPPGARRFSQAHASFAIAVTIPRSRQQTNAEPRDVNRSVDAARPRLR